MPINGGWSDEYGHIETSKSAKLFSINRPRIYYVEMLDCTREVIKVFDRGQMPRFMHEVHFTTANGKNEFSYEDVGLLRLYSILLVLLGALFCLLCRTFLRFYRVENSCLAPHPIIIFGLTF